MPLCTAHQQAQGPCQLRVVARGRKSKPIEVKRLFPVAVDPSQLTETLECLGEPLVTRKRTIVLAAGESVRFEIDIRDCQECPKLWVVRVSTHCDGRPLACFSQVRFRCGCPGQTVESLDLGKLERRVRPVRYEPVRVIRRCEVERLTGTKVRSAEHVGVPGHHRRPKEQGQNEHDDSDDVGGCSYATAGDMVSWRSCQLTNGGARHHFWSQTHCGSRAEGQEREREYGQVERFDEFDRDDRPSEPEKTATGCDPDGSEQPDEKAGKAEKPRRHGYL